MIGVQSIVDTPSWVAGLGARTSVGFRALPSAAAVRAGVSRVMEHPYLKDNAGDPFLVAMDRSLETTQRTARMSALATSAIAEALEAAPAARIPKLTVYLGLPELSDWFTQAQATAVKHAIEAHFRDIDGLRVVTVCEGNASGLVGFYRATASFQSKAAEVSVVAAADTYVNADLLEDLDDARRLCSASHRWGFPPGEGAAALLLTTPGFARGHRITPLGTLLSVAAGFEPASMHVDEVCTGLGLAAVMDAVGRPAGGGVGRQYCDLNGERYREHEFSFALQRVHPTVFANSVDYDSPADRWGYVGAASGVMLPILPLACWLRSAPSPAPAMVWCSSEAGRRGAALFTPHSR